jgi:hypothetical protein
VACQYEAPAFTIRVVDQQTGQPLADVHAIAAWLVYGFHGRRGVLMALEAVSGADGQLSFPAWGPVKSGVEGLVLARDPLISLFKPGYRAKLILNSSPISQSETARVHAFDQAGHVFELTPLSNDLLDTITELRKARNPLEGATVSDSDPQPFKRIYVNRLRRVRAEAGRLPRQHSDVELLLWGLDADINSFGLGGG